MRSREDTSIITSSVYSSVFPSRSALWFDLGPDDDISFHLGYGTLFLAGLAALGTLWDFIHDWRTQRRLRNLLRYRPTQILIVIIWPCWAAAYFTPP